MNGKRASEINQPFYRQNSIYVGTISDAEFCVSFTKVITGFVYLEQRMASVLAVLSGASDRSAANFVISSIVSPTAKAKVLRSLLCKADLNRKRGPAFDEIIDEFEKISRLRNAYVHGRWWTSNTGNKTILDASPDPDQALVKARVVKIKELQQLLDRMLDLHQLIAREVEVFLPAKK